VAVVTRAYREAIDDFFTDESLYTAKKNDYMRALHASSHREFSTGFYLGQPSDAQMLDNAVVDSTHEFLGVVLDYDAENNLALIEQRNKFSVGDKVEFFKKGHKQVITEMFDENKMQLSTAPHPKQRIYVRTTQPVEPFDILRIKKRLLCDKI